MGLFGVGTKKAEDQSGRAEPEPEVHEHEQVSSPTHEALDAYWDEVGVRNPDLITYLVNPALSGAPAWPNIRQAFRIVRTSNTVIIASDGLSDLHPDYTSGGPGFGCEVFIETPELVGAHFDEIQASWQFSVVEQFARTVALHGGFGDKLRNHGVVSMELAAAGNAPQALVSDRDTLGALVGIPAPGRASSVDTPVGAIDIVPITVISPKELDVVFAEGGRIAVAERRMLKGLGHLSVAAV